MIGPALHANDPPLRSNGGFDTTRLKEMLRAAGPPLMFALRFWAAVCLALYIAFWLQLDNAYWAGTSAAIMCQPQLGASLRKGWFQVIGTLVGATMIVVLTACFPQNRIAFLGLLALWCGICAFAATALRNFASFSAALAGYTAVTIAAATLGATGGASTDVFLLAVYRASEFCVGIVCADLVLAGTDLGGAQRRLAASFADLTSEISNRFVRMLAQAGPQLPDTRTERREFVRRVIALDSMIDQALGESSRLRCHLPTLQTAVHGLFRELGAWRGVATHLRCLPDDLVRQRTETILRNIPQELRSVGELDAQARWMEYPMTLRHAGEEAVGRLVALPASTPSLRLLADETAKVLAGMLDVLDALALLVDAPGRPAFRHRGFRFSVPDWLPALVNAARTFAVIGAVELFWVVTAWPSGATAIVFTATAVLLLLPRDDLAYGGALAFALGAAGAVICAATIEFAGLPARQTYAGFCLAIGLFLIPAGFALARSRKSAAIAAFNVMVFIFTVLLAPTNEMSYDTAQFYNSALATVAGYGIAPLAFCLLPPLSPAMRTRRLLALALRDLHRLAIASLLPRSEDWEGRMYGRLAALPGQAEPLQRTQLLAALSVGTEIIQLRDVVPRLGAAADLDAALKALAQGESRVAIAWLAQLDCRLASDPYLGPGAAIALRARGSILVISEALSEHASYFDAGATA